MPLDRDFKSDNLKKIRQKAVRKHLVKKNFHALVRYFKGLRVKLIDPSCIINRYVSSYSADGVIKLSNNTNILSHHGLLKKFIASFEKLDVKGDIDDLGYFKLNYYNKHLDYYIENRDFFNSLLSVSGSFNSPKAVYLLRILDKDLCAGSYKFYKHVVALGVIMFVMKLKYLDSFTLLVCALSSASCLLKIFFMTRAASQLPHFGRIYFNFLPIYSILIPIYQEPNRIDSIKRAISRINYPKNRLDVKLIIEEDDFTAQKELNLACLPSYFYIIKVPISNPRTKPKALNFAAQYISGSYVTIFDAEDSPDPDQLLKSLQKFQNLDEQYVCLQAKLNFYNARENLLTQMQSLEYSIWFDYLLQGMSNTDHIIPLGGTSCHFKVDALKRLGYWDAFNVTEDLELGIRIYSKGYKTAMLESVTLEEAIITPVAWLKQRARWIKGFTQSYIVFCHNRNKFALKFKQKIVIDLFIGIGTINFLTPAYLLLGCQYDNFWITLCVYSNSFLCIMYLLICAYIVTKKNALLNLQDQMLIKALIIIIFPFYFILHTIAAYIAIFQLATSPFKWNKTKHGVSKYDISGKINLKFNNYSIDK